jgi:hypothetical protein
MTVRIVELIIALTAPLTFDMSLSSLLFFVLTASLLVLFVSSQEDEAGGCSEISQQQLDSAKTRWDASGIVSYDYEFDQSCLCYPPGPFAIEVRNCSVVSVNFLLDNDEILIDPPSVDQVSTIDELFTQLQQILNGCSPDEQRPPYSYSVSFDDTYGYPTNVNIDPEELVADEEIIYFVTNFVVIESNDAPGGCGIILPVETETNVPTSGPSINPFDTNAPTLGGTSMESSSVDTNAPFDDTNAPTLDPSMESVDTNAPSTTTPDAPSMSTTVTTANNNCSQAWQQELDGAKELWEVNAIINYDYNFSRFCECAPEYGGPFAIEVRNCSVSSVILFTEGGGLQGISISTDQVPTINDLFMELQDILDLCPEKSPYSYSVIYDEELGYPVEVNIDHEVNIADEETLFSVEGFVAKQKSPNGASCSSVETTNNTITSSSSSSNHLYGTTALVSTTTLAGIMIMRYFGGN